MSAPAVLSRIYLLRPLRWASVLAAIGWHSSLAARNAAFSLMSDFAATSGSSERLMAEHARTFRFSTRFLPPRYRDATIDLYAFFRTLDDLVDENSTDPESVQYVRSELDGWDRWLKSGRLGTAPRPELGRNLSTICDASGIPNSLLLDFLDGVRSDLDPVSPESRQDVERYSYLVASTVGIAMAHVFCATSQQSVEAATRLGIAMQLTNILRDIGGDVAQGRNYLPLDLLASRGLSPDDVAASWRSGSGPSQQLRLVIQEMTSWADEHYAAGIAGVRLLPQDVRMPILVAARLYQQILREIERNDFDSINQRASTSGWQKTREAVRTLASDELRESDSESATASDLSVLYGRGSRHHAG
ncbi:MAG: phytoene/squalene synthase family protein [Thermomicrobiaceae bacterium]